VRLRSPTRDRERDFERDRREDGRLCFLLFFSLFSFLCFLCFLDLDREREPLRFGLRLRVRLRSLLALLLRGLRRGLLLRLPSHQPGIVVFARLPLLLLLLLLLLRFLADVTMGAALAYPLVNLLEDCLADP
jgi:hypothetical protein